MRAFLDGWIRFRPEQSLDEFQFTWRVLPRISRKTVHHIAMRALGHPDAFPGDDPDEHDSWRPWRGYAWNQLRAVNHH